MKIEETQSLEHPFKEAMIYYNNGWACSGTEGAIVETNGGVVYVRREVWRILKNLEENHDTTPNTKRCSK